MFRTSLSSTLILSSLCACTDYEIQSIPSVNDGEQARIEVSPTFIDFGIARENELIQREVTVKNVVALTSTSKTLWWAMELGALFPSMTRYIHNHSSGGSTVFTAEALNPTDVKSETRLALFPMTSKKKSLKSMYWQACLLHSSLSSQPLNMGETYVGCDKENGHLGKPRNRRARHHGPCTARRTVFIG